ncbi:hypothetical protein ARMA_0253 [Ardenticatena maritima]|uniref:GGDEF domain-containing protein n=1 Tax=Ardenticatena maritima TaxID=872965 RepID=A0A0M9UBJ3_9CHLR|nr:GGDEF domain-containing protein [Ardenticatena maritima]KPL87936.1 hypothetical protein SE16_10450 [Ardenticatena maritima]GAP61830.1 hypothetical protein ARMA_0253 [Ardenticatena maritima]
MNDVRVDLLRAQIEALQQKLEFLQQGVYLDEETGVYNRRALTELGEREVQRAKRYHRPLTVIAAGLDQFERIEQVYGPNTAKTVVAETAEVLDQALRATDILGYWGDGIFILVLSETNAAGGQYVAERLVETIAEKIFVVGSARVRVTLSTGMSVYAPDEAADPTTFDVLLRRALVALEEAQSSGKGVIVVWVPTLGEEPLIEL